MTKKKLKASDLFKHDASFIHANACLNFTHDQTEGYVEGYRLSAEHLIDAALRACQQDFLVYPIMFLFRQYIELRLKEILRQVKRVLGEDDTGFPVHHDIGDLWAKARKGTGLVLGSESKISDRAFITDLIREFSRVDGKSDGFRYPVNRKLEPNLDGLTHINLYNAKELLKRLSDSLDGISALLEHCLEIRQEQF